MEFGQVYENENAKNWVYFVCMNQQEAAGVYSLVKEAGEELAIVPCIPSSWENDLTPYEADNPLQKGRTFAGKADDFLKDVMAVASTCPATHRILAGYSLAGLFALYAGTKCSLFDSLVAGSPSLWYPSFMEYAQTHPLNPEIQYVYLSLGDQEAKVNKNPVFQTVDQRMSEYCKILKEAQIPFRFDLNPGKHVNNVMERMAKGILSAIRFHSTKHP